MRTKYYQSIPALTALFACASIHTSAATSIEPPPSCFKQYMDNLRDCNDQFNDDDPGDPNDDQYVNSAAWEQCRNAANDFCDACEQNSDSTNLLNGFWNELITSLKACVDTFGEHVNDPAANPENLQECVEEALDQYRDRLESIPSDHSACDSDLIPTGNQGNLYGSVYVGTMDALRAAAIGAGNNDGKYPTKVNKTVGISAGVSVTPGNPYNVSQIPCVKTAIAFQIYQTKSGTEILPIDADLDTSDGVSFDIMFFGDKLVDATDVAVLAIYFDENDFPLFGEMGKFTIINSPIAGDWNRDEVLTPQDITDFLNSYNAQTNRADLNEDNQVDQQDAVQYLNPAGD